VDKIKWIQGGVYLARLGRPQPNKVNKVTPVVLLTAQKILDIKPHTVLVCPLSGFSQKEFKPLHVELPPRDNLKATGYAMVEHCRTISIKRLTQPRLAQLHVQELKFIVRRLKLMMSII